MNRFVAALAFIITGIATLHATSAQEGGVRQYQYGFSIGGRLPATILLVGYSKDAADVNRLFEVVATKANESFARMDASSPSSEVSRINAKAGQGPVKVSDDVLFAFDTAQKVSNWTSGAFDIASSGGGSWHDIKVAKGGSTVEIKKAGVAVRLDPLIDGIMAELILRNLYAASMQNAIVKVGLVFRGMGTSLGGPWKIEVQDDAGTFARHALNLTVLNTGIAAVSASQFRGQETRCKGVVAVMSDAADAQGVAQAVFSMGPQDGMKVLQKYAKGLIVDNDGKFLRTPGF